MTTPNPGSDAARNAGCTCPVMDNNRGKFPPWPGEYWVTEGCPIHWPIPKGAPDALG